MTDKDFNKEQPFGCKGIIKDSVSNAKVQMYAEAAITGIVDGARADCKSKCSMIESCQDKKELNNNTIQCQKPMDSDNCFDVIMPTESSSDEVLYIASSIDCQTENEFNIKTLDSDNSTDCIITIESSSDSSIDYQTENGLNIITVVECQESVDSDNYTDGVVTYESSSDEVICTDYQTENGLNIKTVVECQESVDSDNCSDGIILCDSLSDEALYPDSFIDYQTENGLNNKTVVECQESDDSDNSTDGVTTNDSSCDEALYPDSSIDYQTQMAFNKKIIECGKTVDSSNCFDAIMKWKSTRYETLSLDSSIDYRTKKELKSKIIQCQKSVDSDNCSDSPTSLEFSSDEAESRDSFIDYPCKEDLNIKVRECQKSIDSDNTTDDTCESLSNETISLASSNMSSASNLTKASVLSREVLNSDDSKCHILYRNLNYESQARRSEMEFEMANYLMYSKSSTGSMFSDIWQRSKAGEHFHGNSIDNNDLEWSGHSSQKFESQEKSIEVFNKMELPENSELAVFDGGPPPLHGGVPIYNHGRKMLRNMLQISPSPLDCNDEPLVPLSHYPLHVKYEKDHVFDYEMKLTVTKNEDTKQIKSKLDVRMIETKVSKEFLTYEQFKANLESKENPDNQEIVTRYESPFLCSRDPLDYREKNLKTAKTSNVKYLQMSEEDSKKSALEAHDHEESILELLTKDKSKYKSQMDHIIGHDKELKLPKKEDVKQTVKPLEKTEMPINEKSNNNNNNIEPLTDFQKRVKEFQDRFSNRSTVRDTLNLLNQDQANKHELSIQKTEMKDPKQMHSNVDKLMSLMKYGNQSSLRKLMNDNNLSSSEELRKKLIMEEKENKLHGLYRFLNYEVDSSDVIMPSNKISAKSDQHQQIPNELNIEMTSIARDSQKVHIRGKCCRRRSALSTQTHPSYKPKFDKRNVKQRIPKIHKRKRVSLNYFFQLLGLDYQKYPILCIVILGLTFGFILVMCVSYTIQRVESPPIEKPKGYQKIFQDVKSFLF